MQTVQRRASISHGSADRLRLDTPVVTKARSGSMSSRSHRKINFNVSEQYEIIDIIGEGAYGVVAYVLLEDVG